MSFLSKSSGRNVPIKFNRAANYDVFKSFDDFFNQRGDEFYDASGAAFSPMVNIEETENSYHVEAELPGVKKEDVDVSLKDDYLIIKGEKKSFSEEKKDQYRRIERSHGNFYRTIALPSDINKDEVNAELKDGLLLIDIKKSQAPVAFTKKIAVH